MRQADLWKAPATAQSTDATPCRWLGQTRFVAKPLSDIDPNHLWMVDWQLGCWCFSNLQNPLFTRFLSLGASPSLLSHRRCQVTNSSSPWSKLDIAYLSLRSSFHFSLPSLSNCPSGNVLSIDYDGCSSVVPSVASFKVSPCHLIVASLCMKHSSVSWWLVWSGWPTISWSSPSPASCCSSWFHCQP